MCCHQIILITEGSLTAFKFTAATDTNSCLLLIFLLLFSVKVFYTLFYTTVLSYLLNSHDCQSQIVRTICAFVHHGAFFISDIFNLYEVRGNFGLLDVFFQSKRCYYHSLSLHTRSPYNHFLSLVFLLP